MVLASNSNTGITFGTLCSIKDSSTSMPQARQGGCGGSAQAIKAFGHTPARRKNDASALLKAWTGPLDDHLLYELSCIPCFFDAITKIVDANGHIELDHVFNGLGKFVYVAGAAAAIGVVTALVLRRKS